MATEHMYLTVDALRAAGGTGLPAADYPDDDEDNPNNLKSAILLAGDIIERATKQWFYALEVDSRFDGNDSDLIQFPVPVISVSALYLNGDEDALDAENFTVYSQNTALSDDRRNPRVKLVRSDQRRDIFTSQDTRGSLRFRRGVRNQRLVGTFGFVEPSGKPPRLIVRAVKLLALEKLGVLVAGGGPAAPPSPFANTSGALVEERTDGHSVRYSDQPFGRRRVDLTGVIKNPEVLDIIRLFKAPITLAAPSNWSWG